MKTKLELWLLIVVSICLGVLLLYQSFPVWSEWHYVDLNSGRLKQENRVLGFTIKEFEVDSRFSESVKEIAHHPPDWRIHQSRSSSNSVSPHYQFHGFPHDLETLTKIYDQLPTESQKSFSAAALEALRRCDLDRILTLTQDAREELEKSR